MFSYFLFLVMGWKFTCRWLRTRCGPSNRPSPQCSHTTRNRHRSTHSQSAHTNNTRDRSAQPISTAQQYTWQIRPANQYNPAIQVKYPPSQWAHRKYVWRNHRSKSHGFSLCQLNNNLFTTLLTLVLQILRSPWWIGVFDRLVLFLASLSPRY